MAANIDVGSVLLLCFKTIISILIVAALGFSGAFFPLKKPILDQGSVKTLSYFCMTYLLPYLCFTSIGSNLNIGMISEIWPLLFWALLMQLVGIVLAFTLVGCATTLISILRRDKENLWIHNSIVVAIMCAFHNPIVFWLPLWHSICPKLHSSPDQCVNLGTVYIFMYSGWWHLTFWTLGFNILCWSCKKYLLDHNAIASMSTVGTASGLETSTTPSLTPMSSEAMSSEVPSKKEIIGEIVRHIFNPTMVGTLLGFLGLWRGFQYQFFESDSVLRSVGNSAKSLGHAALPVIIFVLGASFGISAENVRNWIQSSSKQIKLRMKGSGIELQDQGKLKARSHTAEEMSTESTIKGVNSARRRSLQVSKVGSGTDVDDNSPSHKTKKHDKKPNSSNEWLILLGGTIIKCVVMPLVGWGLVTAFQSGPPTPLLPVNKWIRLMIVLQWASPSGPALVAALQSEGYAKLASQLSQVYFCQYTTSCITVALFSARAISEYFIQ
eukprot:Filipodium_phascolosomae@DN655_c0_g1_i1.p1